MHLIETSTLKTGRVRISLRFTSEFLYFSSIVYTINAFLFLIRFIRNVHHVSLTIPLAYKLSAKIDLFAWLLMMPRSLFFYRGETSIEIETFDIRVHNYYFHIKSIIFGTY